MPFVLVFNKVDVQSPAEMMEWMADFEAFQGALASEGGRQRANLLAVAQVFTRLRYDRLEWLEVFGGGKAMIESPLIQEIVEETRQKTLVKARREDLVRVLKFHLEGISDELETRLQNVTKSEAMQRLFDQAFECRTLAAFEEVLGAELAPPPASTRGKRRSSRSDKEKR